MADKEVNEKVEITESRVKDKKTVVDDTPGVSGDSEATSERSKTWIIWLAIGGALLIVGTTALLIVVTNMVQDRLQPEQQSTQRIETRMRFGGGGYRTGAFYTQSSDSDGLTTTTTTTKYTYTQGVVTKVNGDSIVVAGGGKTQTIKTNSDTSYVDDTKPAVNDTVVVIGKADNDGAVTATELRVAN